MAATATRQQPKHCSQRWQKQFLATRTVELYWEVLAQHRRLRDEQVRAPLWEREDMPFEEAMWRHRHQAAAEVKERRQKTAARHDHDDTGSGWQQADDNIETPKQQLISAGTSHTHVSNVLLGPVLLLAPLNDRRRERCHDLAIAIGVSQCRE
jgi:hypothetical protein